MVALSVHFIWFWKDDTKVVSVSVHSKHSVLVDHIHDDISRLFVRVWIFLRWVWLNQKDKEHGSKSTSSQNLLFSGKFLSVHFRLVLWEEWTRRATRERSRGVHWRRRHNGSSVHSIKISCEYNHLYCWIVCCLLLAGWGGGAEIASFGAVSMCVLPFCLGQGQFPGWGRGWGLASFHPAVGGEKRGEFSVLFSLEGLTSWNAWHSKYFRCKCTRIANEW